MTPASLEGDRTDHVFLRMEFMFLAELWLVKPTMVAVKS